ncbi:hypothetical protein PQJ75_22265 [Rhodoplanes sp. TEM]|uniref:Uncharacterized protein n=1 Tax=Rhodoplanes tepidamans TaxID=200616 RepID=A0ABT5JJD3_RHOTP|nr:MULTISPECIES: hypothetical protein [Rhodoplanes]MDC7789409.1 hypothetical protein [Rhodoplanes tepidamans]MDC7986463.1 hypothetical protein [Rhodoplanes sp. TEM]MDQ0358955.1 hypothetical protein [Rhodoplanes tepidamans]
MALVSAGSGRGQSPSSGVPIDDALQNITTLVRPGRVGYATIWDGNAFVQCRRLPGREMRCEAAGAVLQPSLSRVLTPERLGRLAALGFVLDPSFGHHVRVFPAEVPTATIAALVLQVLTEAYDAKTSRLELSTAWVADLPCPPRAGPTQNLAGSVTDAPSMRATAIRTCSYKADPETPQVVPSAEALVGLYGPTVAAEIQRLRLNSTRRVYVVFAAGIGYVQCGPETAPVAIYCEAQSAESWPALAAVLTPERIARLHRAGFADPGRAPNYSRSYPVETFTDAAIAREILTLLFDVYGYTGATKLKIETE